MPVIDVPDPEFMADEEIAVFRDAVGKFFEQHAPEKRVEKWREDGQVERAFWEEAGEAGLLGVTVPTEYGGHGGDFRHDLVVLDQQAEQGRRWLCCIAAQRHHPALHRASRDRGAEEALASQAGERRVRQCDRHDRAGRRQSDLQSISTTAPQTGTATGSTGRRHSYLTVSSPISSSWSPRPIRPSAPRVSA